ncbi:MAG TPA: response regulator [Candidatus Dormibacteraeota bacterium]|nr:response regulator [Verrucomicrobiae bacterium]HXJ76039.1 response regulator [Candidatus Dormibacteraeota bacterium]
MGTTKGRILIADDDGAFRLATQTLLRRQGFDCESVPDAAGAVELLGQSEFDLLISDIHMPGNAALELVERLPQVAETLPVILLTGHPSVQSAARSVRLRVAAYLVKPCEVEELLSLAEQAIANHRAVRAVRANRQRIESWAQDLARIEQAIGSRNEVSSLGTLEPFFNVTLHNLLAVLLDLKHFTEALAQQPGKEGVLKEITLHRALRDAIEVLERTKQSFKSKELGELRHRLETLLQTQSSGQKG